MVGIQHANEQVHWRHLDCIEPVEVKVLGPPNDSDDFAQLKEDVQSKFSEWHSGALDILDQNSQDSGFCE